MLARLFNRDTEIAPLERAQLRETARQVRWMLDRHVFVDVRVHSRNGLWRTMLLDVDADTREIHIDELFPIEEGVVLAEGELLTLTCRHGDRSLRIDTRVLRVEYGADVISYVVRLPARVELNQRRNCWRLPVESVRQVDLSIELPDRSDVFNTRVKDLSEEGVRIVLPAEFPDPEPGRSVYQQCHLRLNGEVVIRCRLVVRNCKALPNHEVLVGASFSGLSALERRQIAVFMAKRQRRMLRGVAA